MVVFWEVRTMMCCGTCKHSRYYWIDREYCCMNEDSDNFALPTEYNDGCEEWEEKDE